MQLYELTYRLQNSVSPKSCLKDFCDEADSDSGEHTFTKIQPYIAEKVYTVPDNGDTVREVLRIKPYYILCSLSVIWFAIYFLLTGFKLNLIDIVWYAFLLPGSIVVLLFPYWMLNFQPAEFYPEDQSLFGLSRFRPLPFQQQTQMSVVAYLTTLAAGIVLLPVVFPDPNVLAAVFPVSILAVSLIWQDRSDPATDSIVMLTVLTLLPFGIPLINLSIYSQWNVFAQQNAQILTYLTPEAFNQLNQAILPIIQSQTLGVIFAIPTAVFLPIAVMRSIANNTDRIDVFKIPDTVDDKKYLRAGSLLLFATYVGGSIGILLSQLFGYPIIPVETVLDGILIYWPLFVLVPIWFIVWYRNPWGGSIDSSMDVSEPAFEVDDIPVLFRNLGDAAAFPVSDDEPVIVLHEQLNQNLTDEEIQAICYHELYHVKHNSVKYQTWIDIPVVGYLLFLFRTDLSELFNEEYAADEFAAAKVGTEAVVSALTTVDNMNLGRNGSAIQNHIEQGWRGYIQLLFSPPVLSLYSPPRRHRIKRLEEDAVPA
jgi:Zn-dependent protease with chaperone function